MGCPSILGSNGLFTNRLLAPESGPRKSPSRDYRCLLRDPAVSMIFLNRLATLPPPPSKRQLPVQPPTAGEQESR